MSMYPYYPNNYQQPYQQQNYQQPSMPSVRTVSSEAEARAAQIPTDGNPIVFLDTVEDKVYIKRFSFQDGSFPFVAYVKAEPEKPIRYATIDDLNALREELRGVKHESANTDG